MMTAEDTQTSNTDQTSALVQKQAWQRHQDIRLPDEDKPIERNATITRLYAQFYCDRPDLFKWAGMATFASQRVGFFLFEGDFDDPDVRLMRETNNKVFDDIGWAHLAYQRNGLAEIKVILGAQPDYNLIYRGFQLIDQGRQEKNEQLIWQGNILLLRYEQSQTVQNSFNQFSRDFKLSLGSMSWATILEFDGDHFRSDVKNQASFEAFIAASHVPLDFTRFEDRWAWVVSDALPKYRAVEASPEMLKKITRLAKGEDDSLMWRTTIRLKHFASQTFAGHVDLLVNIMSIWELMQQAYQQSRLVLRDLIRWFLLPPDSKKSK